MNYEPCMCGDVDCPSCGPAQGYSDYDENYEPSKGFWLTTWDDESRTFKRYWAMKKKMVPVVPLWSSQWTENDDFSTR